MRRTLLALACGLILAAAPLTAAYAAPPPPGPGCQTAAYFWNNGYGYVDHYYSHGGYFTDPSSGHQDVCTVWYQPTGPRYQLEIVGGPAAGNCLAVPGVYLIPQGCKQGQADEVWETWSDSTVTNYAWDLKYGSHVYCLEGAYYG